MLKLGPFFCGVNVLKKALLAMVLALSAPLAATGPGPVDEWTGLIKASVKDVRAKRLKAAEDKLLKALLTAENFGPQDPRQAYTLDYLGTLYWQRAQYEDALLVYERALKAFDASTENTPLGASEASARRLAEAYEARQLWPKAEPLWRRLKKSADTATKIEPLEQAQAGADLAYNLARQGKDDEALALLDEVLRLRTQTLGPDAVEVAEVLSNQARIQLTKGKLEAAEALARRSLAIDEKALGAEHAVLIDDCRALAAILEKAGKPEAAELEARAAAIEAAQAKPKPKAKAKP